MTLNYLISKEHVEKWEDSTGEVRGRIQKGLNRAEINIGPKSMHASMKGNRDLCLPWGSEYPPDTHRMWDCGSTAQVKDVGVLVDRKSHMSQQWEVEARKLVAIAFTVEV